MPNYAPPYTITSKMLTLATSIGEALSKIEFETNKTITPMLRKKNRIKTIAGTLAISGHIPDGATYSIFTAPARDESDLGSE